ncbi:hypothetical protein Tco_1520246, partial [Tanacetum coccineum]
DLENCVIGEVLQFSSINNLRVLLSNEGFHNTHIVYLGGLWVMIELVSSKTKMKFMQHVGVASWFRRLCNAQSDFTVKERIVWVDIEGVPLNAWSRKVFWARAKELFVWSPSFKEVLEKVQCSDDESNSLNNGDEENECEAVFLVIMLKIRVLSIIKESLLMLRRLLLTPSAFMIYLKNVLRKLELLRRWRINNEQVVPDIETNRPPSRSERSTLRILEEMENSVDLNSSESRNNGIKLKEGGSILEILEEMITVGQTMGFSMEGCTKDIEKIIRTQGEHVVFQ